MAAKIEERFHVGMYKARRVVRTESNYCINQAELKGMKDAGFDEYEFISLGEEAENVCDTCDDLDGERFRISEAAVGVNCPPMHPFCRCKVTTPQETLEDIQADIDRMLEGTSIEEIEQRLDQMIAEREALPESDSTLNSAQESAEKVDKSEKSDIMNIGSDEMVELRQLGTLDTQPLEKEFGKLKTDEVIVTEERITHIKDHHPQDYELFEKYGASTIHNPDEIIKDTDNENTVFMVKRLENTNLNVITKLILESETEHPDYKNSVMSFYRIRNRNLEKLENKHKVLYKKE